jgi:protein-S-isoprenylcysteine O-methyltransferase Ste14
MSTSLRLFNLVSAVVLFAAVIVAEGGVRATLGNPPILAFLVVSLALFVAANFTQGNLSAGVREDRDNRWVIAAFTVLSLGLLVVSIGFDRANILTIGGEAVRWLGVVLYAVGGTLRLAAVFVLGRRFSGLVAIQEGHKLVTDGLYARVRNPSYVGLLVSSVGLALVFRSLPGVILALLLIWPLIARMDAEERLLEDNFGDEYRRYRARTARLIPGVY